jgi:L-threonylcarbamoyladenylate synthase
VRISSHDLARAISAQMQSPVVSTSANLSDEPAVREPSQLRPSIRSGIDLLIDSGATPGGKVSTILSLLSRPANVIREGAIAREDLQPFL